MKRDRTGKFINNWTLEAKQRVNLSLTQKAWCFLEEQASRNGISKSEVIERYARSFEQERDRIKTPIEQETESLSIPNPFFCHKLPECQADLLYLIDSLLAAAPIGICFLDKQLRYIRVNEVLASINGLPIEAHLGKTFREVLPAIADIVEPQLQKVLDTGEPLLNIEISRQTLEGATIHGYWLANYYPVRNGKGETAGVGIILTDVTGTKQAEAAALAANRKIVNILESITDAFISFDREWHFTYVNEEAAKLLRKSKEELIGRSVWDVFPDLRGSRLEQNFYQVFAKQTALIFEEFYAPYDSWVEVHAYPAKEGVSLYIRDISDRKRTEAALQKSEALANVRAEELEAFMEIVPAAVWIARDPECHQMTANPAAYQVMRAEPGTVATATPADRVCPFKFKLRRNGQEIPVEELSMQKAGRTGQEVLEDAELVFDDGAIRHIYGKAVPLKDESGRVRGVIGAFLDVTHHKQLEKELRRQEQQFKTLAENAPDIISRVDREFRHLYVSPAVEKATGISPAAFIGKTNAELGMSPEIYTQWHQKLDQVFRTGEGTSIEFNFPAPDGTRWYQSRLVPEFTSDGSVESVLGIARDVTDYKRVEQALRESEARFRRIFESNMMGMGFYHIDGTISDANDALLDLLGYAREEFLNRGLRWTDITPPEYAALDRRGYLEAVEMGYCNPYEKEFIRKDGTRVSVLAGGGHFEGTHESGVFYTIDLTERKQAEQARKEAEERLYVALKNSPLTVFNQDRELRYTWIYNPTPNYEVDFVIGKRDEDLLSAEDARVLSSIKQQVLETGMGRREEVKLTVEERDWYFDLTVEPLRDQANQVIGITCACVDISDRKQAEAERERLLAGERTARMEAEQMRRQLSTIFETSPVGMAFLDHKQRFVAINEALAEINGLSRQEHLGYTIPELFAQSDPDLVALFQRIYDSGEPFISSELAVNVPGRYDRRPGYYNVYYLPTKDRRQQVEGVVTYVLDVTDRVRLQQAQNFLAEASTVLASSLDYQTTLDRVAQLAVPQLADWCVVHIIEEDGLLKELAVTHINPEKVAWAKELNQKYPIDINDPHGRGAALTLRTGEPDLLPDIPDEILVVGARDPEHLQMLREVGFSSVMTVPLLVQEQVLGVISFVAAESGRHYDRTDLMFAQELARRASLAIDNARLYRTAQRDRARAEAANRVKDEFLAVLSHELRTPLNPIQGWARLLRSRKLDPQTIDRALETIERNAHLQTQLIEDLLDVSRILQGKLSLNIAPVNLMTTITAALETVRLSAEAKGIQIETILHPNVGQVLGDAGRLQQVIWNLLSNSIKFTSHGGRMQIWLERVGDSARIRVIDTGKGISPHFLPYVFDYFRQADSTTTRKFGGLGLGLAIVRHIVELHGGTVQAESPGEEQGATFTINLPLMSAPTNEYQPQDSSDNLANLTGIKILVVDDDVDTRELVAFILEQTGAEITQASSAKNALEILPNSVPDILVCDIGMPEMDGYALMRQVREMPSKQVREIPAIALTAYAGEIDRQQALSAGFQMHLSKPVEPDQLVNAIATQLNRF